MEELLRGLAEERQAAATTDSSPSQTPAADSKVDRETSTDQSMSATLLTLPSSDKTIVTDVPPPMTVHGSSSPERLREATTERSGHLPALTTPAAPAHTQGQEAKSGALSFRQLAGKSAMSNASLGPAMGKQQQKLPAGKKLDRKKKSLLRPAQGFPSRASIKKTAAHHGLFLHANATTVYSDVYQLIEEELKTREDNPHQENKQPLPMERLVEFDSHCINLTSSSLFATAMDYAAGWADEMAEAADERVKTDLAEEVGVEEAVERRMGWLKVGQKREGRLLARGHSGSWKVRLTPLLPFPKLSSMDKVMDSLRAAQANVERGKVQKVPPSATKARHNSQFRALIGDVCGDVAKMNLDVASPAAKAEEATAQVLHESENLLLLSMELQCQRQGADGGPMAIGLICYALMSDTAESPADGIVGFIVLTNETSASRERDRKRFLSWLAGRETFKKVDIEYVASEVQLINSFIAVVQRWDPDIVLGYEIQLSSWGYLIERGTTLGIDMLHSLSRFLKPLVHPLKKRTPKAVAAWEARKMSEIHLVGRVVLNLWRLMRSEVTLTIYTFENVVHHVLNVRLYLYSHDTMTQWLSQPLGHIDRWRAIEYVIIKASLNTKLLSKLDIIRQTSEFSRLFGIQFYDTLTRGSQYRVESMMLRLAKPFSYVPVSPSAPQLVAMVAPESLPLILEPESRLYYDPVIVLDFQSLYPSIVIAYNYCYSTCLGRVELLASQDYIKFGCTAMKVHNRLWMQRNLPNLTFSPNGVAFVKSHIRRGILPQMLEEILNTRIMVKKAMSQYRHQATLTKLLHARQLGLKLIANVTYGYTSASFSGRMPCVEIADSIVAKARETLQAAMHCIQDHPQWNARVVYGDTDSMFVHLPGRSKAEAFRIGRQIEKAITDINPKPMKLKFEKVYMPCLLQTKKRYCGYMYETEEQVEGLLDAKGIETVRRDTCPLVAKTLRQTICMLFGQHCDMTSIKQYVSRVFRDVLSGDVSLQDFVFAKEYRGRESYKAGAKVPALEIAKRLRRDKAEEGEPRIGQRVPYLLVYGKPNETLMALVRQPHEVLGDLRLRPHGFYYCSRQLVPVLNRILLLLGLDAAKWLLQVQKQLLDVCRDGEGLQAAYGDLLYYRRFVAQVFGGNEQWDILFAAPGRRNVGQGLRRELLVEYWRLERQEYHLKEICGACMGRATSVVECQSLDCPLLSQHYTVLARSARLLALKDVLQGGMDDSQLSAPAPPQEEEDWLMHQPH
ncbi:hypothetical protein RvY_18121-1 [Ramazzottius varieornatus]|uniref:DNA polymerase n=1 Tax=Ramazzottius varieornatus TaxID=947166 RepID=A0A1D1W6F0_RAMVA|nr:hypothetical protein RvY_18121-1 [Ramazzottius varieornatus]